MNNINRLVFITETACVLCDVGTETCMFIRATTGPYPEPNESSLN